MNVKVAEIVELLLLKVSNLYAISCGSYGSPNIQNWICKLCTFFQILSHINKVIKYPIKAVSS